MKIIIDVPQGLYANLAKIQRGSIASKRILDCVREGTPISNTVTVEQLEDMYDKYQKKLWHNLEDVRGDDMIDIGLASQFLWDMLADLGCWNGDGK